MVQFMSIDKREDKADSGKAHHIIIHELGMWENNILTKGGKRAWDRGNHIISRGSLHSQYIHPQMPSYPNPYPRVHNDNDNRRESTREFQGNVHKIRKATITLATLLPTARKRPRGCQ